MAAEDQGSSVLRLDAVLDGVIAVLLLSRTWDGLYALLDLPHSGPALLTQLGGAALLGLAYLLWVAPSVPGMARPVALAAAVANGLGAAIIAAWLILRTNRQLEIGTQGVVELVVVAVVLAGLALAQARIARRPA